VLEARWIDDQRLEIKGSKFVASSMHLPVNRDHQFVIVKPPDLVQRYLDFLEGEQPRRVVELGIREGGSTALLALAADPELFLAVDIESKAPPLLASLVDELPGVHMAFGLDQADRAGLTQFVDPHGCGFDLVIDDASHVLDPTRVSFEVLFPRLRPGGVYIIEDWATDWDIANAIDRIHRGDPDFAPRFRDVNTIFYALNHTDHGIPDEIISRIREAAAVAFRNEANTFIECVAEAVDRPDIAASLAALDLSRYSVTSRPLADLAVELTMIRASRPDVIAELCIDGEWLMVRRGSAFLRLDEFRLADLWTDYFRYLS
jgi:SAM-dependent methyltransferase